MQDNRKDEVRSAEGRREVGHDEALGSFGDIESVVEALAREVGIEDAREIIRDQLAHRPAQAQPVAVARTRAPRVVEPSHTPRSPGVWTELKHLFGTLKRAPERTGILMLAAGIVVVLVGNMIGQVRLNNWNGDFYDAIEAKDFGAFGEQLLVFLAIIAVLLGLVVSQTWLQEMLKVRLRGWLTKHLLNGWLAPGRAYRLGMASELGVNPDQRIQEDTRQLTEMTTELGVGLLQATMLLVSFIGVLWALSSNIAFTIGGEKVVIPGYMVWCAIGYAGLGSWLTWKVGAPLIQLNAHRYQREAEFRFALVRVSESAESVALYGGEPDERRALDKTAGTVIEAMRRLSGALSRLTWITSGYGWVAIVFPLIVASPGYFSGDLTLGGLMMVVGAFNQVQASLRWFVDTFPRIADWRATVQRVSAFQTGLETVDELSAEGTRIALVDHPEGGLAFDHAGVHVADGKVVIEEATAEIKAGERVLIVGESGTGKSTLFRAMAGLWPWGTGRILLPPRGTMMFMPQRPYMPLGTLRAALAYPAAPDAFQDADVRTALERVGIGQFAPMLDKDDRWDKILSLGQQQRLAFARLLLHKPRWVFLDEATAALDEENQRTVMSIFDRELPDTTIVSIGHRPGLEAFHTRKLMLTHTDHGAHLERPPVRPGPILGTADRLLTRVLRSRNWLGRHSSLNPRPPV